MELINIHYYENEKKIKKEAKKLGYNLKSYSRGVAHFEKDGKNIISIKGTNPDNITDLISDFKIAVGLTNKDTQFKNRKKELKKIYKNINDDETIDIVAHSLGGSIATSILSKSKSLRERTNKADLYNTGYTKALHKELRKDLSKKDRQELNEIITHHRVENDIVSQGLRSGSVGKVLNYISNSKSKSLNHALAGNFNENSVL